LYALSCWSGLGNYKQMRGQRISCCTDVSKLFVSIDSNLQFAEEKFTIRTT